MNHREQQRKEVQKIILCILLLTLFVPLYSVAYGSQNDPEKRQRVLLITSGNKNLPAFKALEKGLDKALQFTAGRNDVFFEFMESPLFFTEDTKKHFSAYLTEKYSHLEIHYVIGWVEQAVTFLRERPELFPAAGRIYLEASRPENFLKQNTDDRISWIEVYDDFGANLVEMVQLFPAEHIIVIGDSESEGARERRLRFSQALSDIRPLAKVEYLYDLPLDQIKERLKKKNPKTAAYYLLMFSDGRGTPMTPYAVVNELSVHSAIPIFSYWESLLGSGIVGGRLMSHQTLGEQIGHMLLGSKKNIETSNMSALKTVYDWKAIAHWDIDSQAIPEQATIINRPVNRLEEYKYYVWLTGAVMASLCIIVLLLSRILIIKKKTTQELATAYGKLEEKVRDRTEELEKANSVIEEERQRFFSILEELPGFLYLQAQDYSIAFANRNFKNLFGEPKGRPCHQVIQGLDHPCEPCPTFKSFSSPTPQTWQWLREKTGRTYQIYDFPFTDADGEDMVLEMGIDITEQKDAEQALKNEIDERKATLEKLRKSEEQYRTLVENSPDIIYRFSIKEGGFFVSSRVQDILGYDANDLMADPFLWYNSIHNDDRNKVDDSITAASKGGSFAIEYRIRHKDGHWVWLRDRSMGLSGNEGEIVIEGLATDITELRRIHQALVESEQKYRLIFNSAPVGIFKSSAEGKLLDANPQYASIFGYSSVDELFKVLTDNDIATTLYADPDDRKTFVASLRKNPNKWANFVAQYRRSDGSIIICRTQYRSSIEPSGQEIIEGFIEDISHRKATERYLLHYESLVSAIDDMLAFVDTDLRYRQVNDAVVEAFGQKREEIIGKKVEQILGEKLFEQSRPYYERCLAGEKTVQEVWTAFPKKEKRYYRIIRYPMRSKDNGEIYGIAIVTSDLTAIRKAQDELTRANEELSRANEELDQFVYVVSHDLKSPLRAIQNYADFIQEDLGDTVDEDLRTYLLRMGKAVNRSEQLVDDLLEFSRIGRTDATIERIDLNGLFQEILEDFKPNRNSVITVQPELPYIFSNKAYLVQIFKNLITNGLKFNISSPRTVDIYFERGADGWSTFKVTDNGIGINPRYQKQIFKVFSRLHTSEEFEGTGIGLAIVRKAVDILGGTVAVTSAEKEGTTFSIQLPDPLADKRAEEHQK